MMLISGILTKAVLDSGIIQYDFFGGLFHVDAVSVIILDIVVMIGFLVSIYSIGYLSEELRRGEQSSGRIRFYYTLMFSFLFTMVFALTVNSIGVLWIAIEGTTLASTFLVGFHNDKYSIEAAWKYVIICSVGIAIALVGIIFLHLSSVAVIDKAQALQWNILSDHARELNSPVLRLSFLFIIIGF
jgi:hydrogenase-4 component F